MNILVDGHCDNLKVAFDKNISIYDSSLAFNVEVALKNLPYMQLLASFIHTKYDTGNVAFKRVNDLLDKFYLEYENKSNLKSGGGLNTYGLRGRSGKYYSLLPASGLSVPNCTAWAFARIFELMVATGYACKDQNEFNEQNKDGKLIYLTSTTGMNSATSIDSKNIRYSYGLLKTVLDCGDGRQFIDRWPGVVASSGKDLTLMNKWRAKGWAYNATTPRPGCIVAWRNKYGSYWNVPGKSGQESGFPGHVAVVEKVLNAGTEKESIIVSESNYSGGGTAWDYIVRMYEIKKKNDYGMGDYGLYQLQCLWFGYCPACDSVSSMPPGNPSGVTGVSQ